MSIDPAARRVVTRRLIAALCTLAAAWPIGARAEPVTGTSRQPLILGDDVSRAQQKELGLVTINGGCSGTLLNTYWILTASHCVTTDGRPAGLDTPLAQIAITATWRRGTVTPIRSVRFQGTHKLDVALLFLSYRLNFGSRDRNTRQIYHAEVDTSMTLTKFGQGICSYATGSGASARRAQFNCGYRTAQFTPSSAGATRVDFVPNEWGQTAAFGDSGGPDYVTDGDGNLLSIASVTTGGQPTYVADKPKMWAWVNDITESSSAALLNIRDDIIRLTKEVPPNLDLVTEIPGTGAGDFMRQPDAEKVSNRPGAAAMLSSPANCKPGYVWRVARPEDLVCVTPAARALAASENAAAPNHVDPYGAYGTNSCAAAYVWRNAFEGDLVCVTPHARDRVAAENRLGPGQIAMSEPQKLDVLVDKQDAPVSATLPHDSFTGVWTTVAAGRRYTMQLTQNGSTVSGVYKSEVGGSTGTIEGSIERGPVADVLTQRAKQLLRGALVYRWTEGGSKGSGKFVLGDDGNSFDGWWNSGNNPDIKQNSWTGKRTR